MLWKCCKNVAENAVKISTILNTSIEAQRIESFSEVHCIGRKFFCLALSEMLPTVIGNWLLDGTKIKKRQESNDECLETDVVDEKILEWWAVK